MSSFLVKGHTGIKGLVTDSNNNPVHNAKIEVTGRAKDIYTTERGEYWRLLLPGTYSVRAVSPTGFHSETVQVTVSGMICLCIINFNILEVGF